MNTRRTAPGLLVLIALLALLGASRSAGGAAVGGAVASAAPAATAAGLEVLAWGGNAVDAAVATALALAVVHPEAGNLGGGGFAVVRVGGVVAALDFRETAPAAACRDMYLDASGEPRPEASLVGGLAVGVPGSPAGYFELQRRFGKLPWAQVVGPAIRLAEGFTVTSRLASDIEDEKSLLARFAPTARVWLPGGSPPQVGSTMRLHRLAAVLRAYAADGPGAVTGGARGEALVAAVRAHGGIMTAADIGGYRPVWREPLRFRGFGWELAGMPLPSSGGIIMAQTLGLLERVGWARQPAGSAQRIHLLAESWRRAFADRFLLGDPSSTRASAEQLLAASWLDRRAAEIDPGHATPSTSVLPWPPRREESPETTHLSVVDGEGNAVALTTTLNGSFGSGLLVPELEILLNNEMDDFATAPGRANLYGLVQGEANAVAPGRRMLSSMTPTLAWRGGEVLAIGSPGGSRIPTATTQVLLAVLVDGAPLDVAVARPRIHHQWMPDEVRCEECTPELEAALGRLGHRVQVRARLGEVHVVRRWDDARLEAAADPRGPGAAAVLPVRLPRPAGSAAPTSAGGA
ncbi:MAG: gamma-glutamyltransferase [Thermoanaerobaculaceae bacterium]